MKQSLAGYRYYQDRIAELDREIQTRMREVGDPTRCEASVAASDKRTQYQRQAMTQLLTYGMRLYRIAGVDLTDIPGVSTLTAQVVLSEIGPDVSRFRNASAFASWLGLCPEKRVSGG